jgi:hypothetical protein
VTPVIFKYDKGSRDVFAAFPTLAGDMNPATMTSYAHLGQHSAASMDYVAECKPAAPADYAPLLKELRAIGYDDLVIRRRMTRADFLEREKQVRQ